jgi:rhamnogalacturonan endolyase
LNTHKKRIAIAAGLAAASLLVACGGGNNADSSPAQKTALLATTVIESFGLTSDANFYTIDTGAGLVFKVRRTDSSSTTSIGDISSMVFNGVQYQNPIRGSQLNSGFDWLYSGISAVNVTAAKVGTDFIKVTVTAGNMTHYYMAKRGEAKIYMADYFTSEPTQHGQVRYIVRVPRAVLPNGPAPSNLDNNTGAIEGGLSGDVFGMANGETRSKHYSNRRTKDWSFAGATGPNVGMWMVRDNNEGSSGGPFYRSLMNQAGGDQELTYIVNYGEAQTEDFRLGVLDAYTLVFTTGANPSAVDTSWFGSMGLAGYVAPAGRGRVTGVGINNRNTSFAYTVGFSNAKAQYWVNADPATGYYNSTGMRPGTYKMKIYKNELVVDEREVTVTAGGTTALNSITLGANPDPLKPRDPTAANQLWRIGNWDGTPVEFVNGNKITTMHPQDVRMSSWNTPAYVIGSSTAGTGWPAYQFKSVNDARVIKFNLTTAQAAGNYTLRVGITTAQAGARPQAKVNGWTTPWIPSTDQPSSRTMTVGTYRGNNVMFSFDIPAGTLVAGANSVTLYAMSGTSAESVWLNPSMSYDAVDMIPTP